MPSRITALALLTILAVPAVLHTQGRIPLRGTFDDRLAKVEERLAAVEDRQATDEEDRARKERPTRLTLESEAKLDRLEVRVIQLETRPSDCECDSIGQRALLERIQSLERQLARVRSTINR